MTARNGLSVERRTMPHGKDWLFVKTQGTGSPVAFQDWYDQVRILVECEVKKYGGDPANPVHWERWGQMAKEFLLDCFEFDATYEVLRVKHRLPR